MELKYGEITIESTKLPEASVAALMRRGLAHFLGNEQASKVASKFKDEPYATDEAKSAYKNECVKNAIEALAAGTIGANLRGPKAPPQESLAETLAWNEVKGILVKGKLKVPTGDGTIEFPDGEGGKILLGKKDFIARRMAKHGERLMKEAAAELKRREREVAKAEDVGALL